MSSTVATTCAGASGIVLEVAQDLGERARPIVSCGQSSVGSPSISAVTIAGSGRARSAMISIVPWLRCRRAGVGDLGDVVAQRFDPARRERLGRERADPGVLRRIEEEHLADHHRGDGCEPVHPQRRELLRGRGAVGREGLQDGQHVVVARDDPCVQERVPVHGGLVSQAAVQRVRIREDLGIEELVEAQARSPVRPPPASGPRSFAGLDASTLGLLVGLDSRGRPRSPRRSPSRRRSGCRRPSAAIARPRTGPGLAPRAARP